MRESSVEKDQEALRKRRERWVTVVNARDRDGYAALFTADGVWIPPGLPAVSGREAIRSWLQPFFDQFEYEFTLTDPELRLAGNFAVECGTFTSRLTPVSGGETSSHSGKYVILWRRDTDGGWYMDRYVDVTGMFPGI